MQAKTENLVTADISMVRRWKDDDPTVFEMTIAARLQGDFQITNGYGPTKAAQVMKVKGTRHKSPHIEIYFCLGFFLEELFLSRL